MWLLFDRNGKLTKQIEYSNLAYVTSTNFYLFCVFENLDPNDLGLAHLSLRKPSGALLNFEISGTKTTKKFEVPNQSLENSYLPFVNNQNYTGVEFDFSQTGFLDEVGLWKGTLTFYIDGIRNLTGLFTFMVQPSVVNTQIGPVTYDQYLLLLSEIAQKQDHLYAGAGIAITNGIISVTVDIGGGIIFDFSKYVTLEYLANYHDATKQDVIDAEHKLPAEFIEGGVGPVGPVITKVSQLENDMNYTTKSYVDGIIPDPYDDTAIKNRIGTIESYVPSDTTIYNKLADQNFVNSSISTATATFKGTFDSLTELQETSADANDYAFYRHTDTSGNTMYSRYKYADGTWSFEYDLNNSSFTSAQWANINADLSVFATQEYVQVYTSDLATETYVDDEIAANLQNYVDKINNQVIKGEKIFRIKPCYQVETTSLPTGYTELEYIQSSGTQLINTGLVPTNNTKVELKSYVGGSYSRYLFGTRTDSSGTLLFSLSGSGTGGTMLGCANGVSLQAKTGDNVWGRSESGQICIETLETNNGSFTYNAQDLTNNRVSNQNGTYTPFTTTLKMFIFSNGFNTISGTNRVYYCKIWQNGVLVRNLIPCTNGTRNGLYDTVNNTFYPSETSNFIAGPQVIAEKKYFLVEGDLSGYATESYVDSKTKNHFRFMGNVATFDNLPARVPSTLELNSLIGEQNTSRTTSQPYCIAMQDNTFSSGYADLNLAKSLTLTAGTKLFFCVKKSNFVAGSTPATLTFIKGSYGNYIETQAKQSGDYLYCVVNVAVDVEKAYIMPYLRATSEYTLINCFILDITTTLGSKTDDEIFNFITNNGQNLGNLDTLASGNPVVITQSNDEHIGEVYNTTDTGMNYEWNGMVWDELGIKKSYLVGMTWLPDEWQTLPTVLFDEDGGILPTMQNAISSLSTQVNDINEELDSVDKIHIIDTQTIKLWDLDVGIYKLTYEGEKVFDLRINATESRNVNAGNSETFLLFVSKLIRPDNKMRKSFKFSRKDWTKVAFVHGQEDEDYCSYINELNDGSPIEYVNWSYVSNIWAPTSNGTLGQILQANGGNNAPTWFTPNYAQLDVSNTFTKGQKITRTDSGAILELESAAGDTNFLLTRTGGSQCVLESGASVGLFGTKSNHPLQVRTNYTCRMTFGTDGSVTLATDVAANSNSNQLATTKWVVSKGYLTSHQSLEGYIKAINGIISGFTEISNDTNDLIINPVTTFNSGVNLGDNKIESVATPTADTDAANKKYVDDAIEAYMSSHYENGNTGSY